MAGDHSTLRPPVLQMLFPTRLNVKIGEKQMIAATKQKDNLFLLSSTKHKHCEEATQKNEDDELLKQLQTLFQEDNETMRS